MLDTHNKEEGGFMTAKKKSFPLESEGFFHFPSKKPEWVVQHIRVGGYNYYLSSGSKY